MTTPREIERRVNELEANDEQLNQLSISMVLSEPDRYDLVDEDRRIYRDTKTGKLGRAPWVDKTGRSGV